MRRKKQKDVCDKNASYVWGAISIKNHSVYIKRTILLRGSVGVGIAMIHFEDTDFEELRPRNKRRKMVKDSDEDEEVRIVN